MQLARRATRAEILESDRHKGRISDTFRFHFALGRKCIISLFQGLYRLVWPASMVSMNSEWLRGRVNREGVTCPEGTIVLKETTQ